MWYRTQIGNMAIRRSVSNQRLYSWRSNFFTKWISVSIQGIFLQLHIRYRTVIWYSPFTFVCDRSLMQDTLPEEEAPALWCLGFSWRDFSNNSHLSLYVNYTENDVWCLPIIRIKVRYLKSCVTGRLCLGCLYYSCYWIFFCYYTYVRCKQCNCSCNQPQIMHNLLEK